MATASDLTLRLATMADAEMLLEWRNDAATRAASKESELVAKADHMAWLERSLRSAARKIYIVESQGVPCGTVRTDFSADETILSWTVSPKARGQGIGARAVKKLADSLVGKLRAEVREDNVGSEKIALAAGFALIGQNGEFKQFIRTNTRNKA